jgi:hypothetical protein
MRSHPPTAEPVHDRGLRRIAILVPADCAEGLLHLARELRTRQTAGMSIAAAGWRRLSPSAELFVDPRSGARCAVRDTGALGVDRYLWTVTVFSEHQVAAGHAEEIAEARSQAETALSAYLRQARVL